jgi:hypothetical protein
VNNSHVELGTDLIANHLYEDPLRVSSRCTCAVACTEPSHGYVLDGSRAVTVDAQSGALIPCVEVQA